MNITLDKVGRPKISSNELFEIIYAGRDSDISMPATDEIKSYISLSTKWGLPIGVHFARENENEEKYVQECLKNWPMPEEYKNIDLYVYFANKISTAEQAQRVSEELELYEQHNLVLVLKFMIYLVEVMKKNNIVWGVGRGSSVSSYLLFLVGLHKIDSLKYSLDIKEFLK